MLVGFIRGRMIDSNSSGLSPNRLEDLQDENEIK